MDDTPKSLLERLRERPDDGSWSRLVSLYTPFLQRVVTSQGVPAQDCDDLLQDVFSVLSAELSRFDHNGNRGAFRLWLRTILTNRVRRYFRSSLRTKTQFGTTDSTDITQIRDPEDDLVRMWDEEYNQWVTCRLIELIEPEFSISTWRAFHRQVLDGARAKQTADELGLTVNAVLIAKSRVLRRLRQEMEGLTD
ncbi:MAG: sigma-70 family RNA polymerase sigma factor [Planctomycetaceae bacterium]